MHMSIPSTLFSLHIHLPSLSCNKTHTAVHSQNYAADMRAVLPGSNPPWPPGFYRAVLNQHRSSALTSPLEVIKRLFLYIVDITNSFSVDLIA